MSDTAAPPELWYNRILAVFLVLIVALLIAGTVWPLPFYRHGSSATPFLDAITLEHAPQRPSGHADRPTDDTDPAGEAEIAGAAGQGDVSRAAGDSQSKPGAANEPSLAISEIDFDLADSAGVDSVKPRSSAAQGNRIKVLKPVVANGTRVGSITLTIDENSRLFMDGADLDAILPANKPRHPQLARAAGSGLVSFQRLRELGVNLRYDPIADRIEVQQ